GSQILRQTSDMKSHSLPGAHPPLGVQGCPSVAAVAYQQSVAALSKKMHASPFGHPCAIGSQPSPCQQKPSPVPVGKQLDPLGHVAEVVPACSQVSKKSHVSFAPHSPLPRHVPPWGSPVVGVTTRLACFGSASAARSSGAPSFQTCVTCATEPMSFVAS